MVLKRQLPSRLSKTSKAATPNDAETTAPTAEAATAETPESTVTTPEPKAVEPTPAEPVADSFGADDDELSAWLDADDTPAAPASTPAPEAPAKQPVAAPAPVESKPVEKAKTAGGPKRKAKLPAKASKKAEPKETKKEIKPTAKSPAEKPAASKEQGAKESAIKAEGLTAADFPEPTPIGETPAAAPPEPAPEPTSAPIVGAMDDEDMPYFPGDDLAPAEEPKQVAVPPSWEQSPADAKPPLSEPIAAPQSATSNEDDWDVDELVSNDLPTPTKEEASSPISSEPVPSQTPDSGLQTSAKPAGGAGAPPPDFYATPAPDTNVKAPIAPQTADDALDELEAEAGGSKTSGKFKLPKMDGIPGLPPQMGGRKSGITPPELPTSQPQAGDKGPNSSARNALLLLVVVAILGGGYYTVQNLTSVQEGFARATGTLSEFSEDIPTAAAGGIPAPEQVIVVGQSTPVTAPAPEAVAAVTPQQAPAQPPATPAESVVADEFSALEEAEAEGPTIIAEPTPEPAPTTEIEFVDVSPAEADDPVVASAEAELPAEVSLFANLQQAILEAREEKRRRETALTDEEEAANIEVDPNQLSRVERNERSAVLQQELEVEMQQYRQVLAAIQNPALRPSPNEFFNDPQRYLDLAAQGAPAPAENATPQIAANNALPRAEISPDNPYNLPYLPEPQVEATPQVRQFNEFNTEAFTPQIPRVRIPSRVQPRLRASDFPGIEVLSLVPNKGLIAYHEGREGVLLIGETIEGWELIDVYDSYAEFANGQRKHLISLN